MEIIKLIKDVEQKGIKLWADGDKLKFKAPSGIVDNEIRSKLKDNKELILSYLKKVNLPIHDEISRYDSFELTDIQTSYLFGSSNAYKYGQRGCKVFAVLETPVLNETKLKEAWTTVIMKHDMLHTEIFPNGKQRTLREVHVPDIQVINMSEKDDEDVEKTLQELETEKLQTNFFAGKWPFFNIVLIHRKNKDTLCLTVDMLIADFASMRIIVNELEDAYYDRPLYKSTLTYKDILDWRKNTFSKSKFEEAKDYWLNRMESIPEAPELPMKQMEGESGTVLEFEQHSFKIPRDTLNKLSKIAKDHELTISNLILTVYAKIIGLWSKQQDFVINVTMDDRPDVHEDINNIVGDFTIVDLLEIHNGGRKNFFNQAAEIQNQLFTDLEYKQFTGVQVMREINRRIETARIFPIVYTSTIGTLIEKKREFHLIHKITQTPQVFLDCQVSTLGNSIIVNWDVRKNIFPDGMIDDAFGMFCNMIKKLAEGRYEDDKYIEMGLPYEMLKAREKMNETEGIIPKGLLQDKIKENIYKYPNSIALITSKQEYSYESLGRYAMAISTYLRKNGAIPNKLVAINLNKGIWQVAAVLGTLWAGCAYLPLDCEQPEERKKEILASSGAEFYITAEHSIMEDICVVNVMNLQVPETLILDEVRVRENSLAYVIYTSGSSGKPKGVAVSHQSALNTICDINERYKITNRDRVIAIANLAFDLSVYDIFGTLAAGGTLVIPDPKEVKNPHHWEEMIYKYNVTIRNSVPAQMQMLVFYIQGLKEKKDYMLRKVFLSGDWIPVKLPQEVQKIFSNCDVVSLGGATEAAIWSIHYDIETGEQFKNSVPYGFPLKNQYFRILNENMDDCPDFVTGELMIGGIGLAEGYFNNVEQTDQSFITHPLTGERLYRTGDRGCYTAKTGIEFQGRKDNQVKINGYRIELNEIESRIQEEKYVNRCAVVAFDNSIVAFLRPESISQKNISENEQEIAQAIFETGEKLLQTIDEGLFNEWSNAADETAMLDMMQCLYTQGIFVEKREYSIEEIYNLLHIHPAFKKLVIRWLEALSEAKMIDRVAENGKYIGINKNILASDAQQAWERWNKIEENLHYGKKLMDYFGEMRKNLILMLNGTVDPLDIYFPKGNQENAIAAYHDNIISKIMNQIMGRALVAILDEKTKEINNKKIRILEIGSGIGGASRDLIPLVDKYNVEYIFTDISQYYLNEAKKTFRNYDFIVYKMLNMNQSFVEQGIESESIDIIIFSQAIHNAENIGQVLSYVREVMTRRGKIIIADTTGERKALLTSVAFNIRTGDTFFSISEYKKLFENENISLISVFPSENGKLSEAKQNVFVGTYLPDRERIDLNKLQQTIALKLPNYMMPNKFIVTRELPLNRNGKLDKGSLFNLLQKEKLSCRTVEGEYPVDRLEKTIERIWAKALNRERLFRNENFYQAGGDSLLIAQVVADMKENILEAREWEWDSLMREIIETPTIEDIAKKLKTNKEMSNIQNEKEDNVITFLEGNNNKKIKVLFHDGTGTIYPYQNLIPYLKKTARDGETIIGVFNDSAEEYERMTADGVIHGLGIKYGKILCKLNFEKYELIGFCFGGMVAVEVSKYLQQEGKYVLPVRTIDTPYCDKRISSELLMERTFGMSLGIDMRKYGYYNDEKLLLKALNELLEKKDCITDDTLCSLEGEYSDLGKSFKEMINKGHKTRLSDLYEEYINLSDNNAGVSWEKFEATFRINHICFEAMGKYDELFIGNVVDMYCNNEEMNFFPMLGNKGGTFWPERVVGNLEEIAIDGNHNTCLKEPIVEKVATIIENL